MWIFTQLNRPTVSGVVKRPEDYRWCSLGYHVQSRNKGELLSVDFREMLL
jgi:hypothetical protein